MGELGQIQQPAGVQTTLANRIHSLQRLGVLCGIAAGAWLGAAEVPAKLVSAGLSPFLISFLMVLGVFLGRWCLPAIARGTSDIGADVSKAPHLIIWAIVAGCLWSVANTLTVFAIRDLGLSIAFPLWNTNALIGILWGVFFFGELKNAGRARWAAVLAGAALMFIGGLILARVSASQMSSRAATKGIVAALGAGVLWGTMYIPYRKAYLSGMNPLSFVSFFTVGELGMMTALAARYLGGLPELWRQVSAASAVQFWLLAAGFVWVIGDIFQQYAVKYVGVSRGIPLSNSNQLWGLLWGAFAFGEFRNWPHSAVAGAVYGSILMALGMAAISFSVADKAEHDKWREAASREQSKYGIDPRFISSAMEGTAFHQSPRKRWLDVLLVGIATALFVWTAAHAHWPAMNLEWTVVDTLLGSGLILLVAAAVSLWKMTRFN
jgi:drug/metabolite transporter (DMT)-like permease